MTTEWFMQPFEMDTSTGLTAYRFVMPGIAISGDNVEIDYDTSAQRWELFQEDEDGRRWYGRGPDQVTAMLDLIANRAVVGHIKQKDPEATDG